jgi:hypothetical protein
MSRIGSVLLAFFLLAGVLWAGRQGRTTSLNAEWAARYDGEIRRVLNVPPSATLEFKRARPGGDDHYAVAVFDARAGEDSYPLELTVSPDGQTVLYEGRTYALDDPFAANRAGIDLTDDLTQEQPLLEKHAGQVRLVYKHFPLTEHRPGADDVAVAAACAYRHGNEAFWAYHKRLFQEADRLAEGRNLFLQLAREVGLDGSRFARCVDERQGLFDVARDVAEGEELGIRGTPAFFVNGRPVLGLVRPEHFSYIIEQELAAARGR